MDRPHRESLVTGIKRLLVAPALGCQRLIQLPAEVRFVAVATGAIVLLGLAGWLFTVPPAFVHAELYGPELITAALKEHSVARAEYAHIQGGLYFQVLHALSALTGRTAEGVVAANSLLAALAVVLLGILAARWSRLPVAALLTAALAMSSPLISRIARSEDASPTASVLALLITLAVDVAGRRRSILALVGVGVLGQIFPQARQTFFAWTPMWLVLWVELRRRAHRAEGTPSRGYDILGGVAILAIPVACAISMIGRNGKHVGMLAMGFKWLFSHAWAIQTCFVMHPLFDWRLSAFVLPLAIVGALWLFRQGRIRWAWLAGFGASFALGLPETWPSLDNLWAFRMPTYLLALLAAGVGAAAVQQKAAGFFAQPRASAVSSLAFSALLMGAALLAPRAREIRVPDAEFTNYLFVRDAILAQAQQQKVGVVSLGQSEVRSAAGAVANLFDLPLVSADVVLANGPRDPSIRWLWADELPCHSFSIFDLIVDAEESQDMVSEMKTREALFTTALFGRHQRFGLDLLTAPVPVERQVCAELRARTTSLGVEGPRIRPLQSPPMSVFADQLIVPDLRALPSRDEAAVPVATP